MNKLEHIGIAVKDLEASERLFSLLLNTTPYKREEVESEGVLTSFFLVGNVKIELLAATRADSAIAKFIEKRGEGLHHLAFDVDNAEEKMETLRSAGFEWINNEPKDGADLKRIAFLHPKSTNGVLTEICQDKNA
jgi:methylmalonyl-CoA/ethylmalonyl-CoA epimerase